MQKMITEQDVWQAFSECDCHDGTSLAAFLFPVLFPGDPPRWNSSASSSPSSSRGRTARWGTARTAETRLARLVASCIKRLNQ
jgi:hypothetical protein